MTNKKQKADSFFQTLTQFTLLPAGSTQKSPTFPQLKCGLSILQLQTSKQKTITQNTKFLIKPFNLNPNRVSFSIAQ